MNVKKGAMTKFVNICTKNAWHQIRLGESYTEIMAEMYVVSRYTQGKKEWIKWKKLMNRVAQSDMKISTMFKLVVYPIFEEGGLYDQSMAYEKAEVEALMAHIKENKLWEMNMNMPEGCKGSNDTCTEVSTWVKPDGVSDEASNMKNFQPDDKNVTLEEFDNTLDMFKDYEDAMKAKEPEAESMAAMILKALEEEIDIFNKTRILADEVTVVVVPVEDNVAGAFDAGEDNQIEEADAEAVTEIDQAEPTKALEEVDAVSDADSGVIGDDSTVTDEDTDSGSSWMTWVMWIGGAILLLVLLGGVYHLCQNRSDADEFEHNHHDTQMTHHDV